VTESFSHAQKFNWKYALVGGLGAGVGTLVAWIIVGKLIH
jgi:putative flippase GtrA